MGEEAEEDAMEEEEMREETISRIQYELSRAHLVFRRRLEGKFKLISQ